MCNKKSKNVVLIFLLILFVIPIKASPVAYLTENVNAEFNYNGTLISQENIGYIEVEVPNREDVLQNVKIILSSTAKTNLNSRTAYSAVAASPSSGDKTKLYLNTNESNESIYYKFYDAPIINITLSYENEKGGKDLTPKKNKINFKLFLSANENLNGVEFNIKAKKDTYGENDSLSFISASATTGEVSLIDSDSDGFKDNLKWIGNLRKTATINFTAALSPGINYPEDELTVDIDSKESSLIYSQPKTFTGITFSDRFARGPVRQGVEITAKTNWTVKGFLKNIAYGLIYYVDSWSLYKVGESEALASKKVERNILPGGSIYTDEYDTGIPSLFYPEEVAPKPPELYYLAAFDWNVVWGGSEYFGIINEKINLPKFYQMELGVNKRIDIIKNDETGRILMVEDEIKHLGHSNLQIRDLDINLTGLEGWNLINLKVFYINDTNKTEITNYTTRKSVDILEIKITNISEKIEQNDIISVEYNLSRGVEDENKKYTFGLNVIATTKSGTPVEKNLTEDVNVPGLKPIKEVIHVGAAPEIREIAEIIKVSAEEKFITSSMIENNISFKVIDTGDKGIRNPIFFLYLPEKSYIDINKIEIYLLRSSIKKKLEVEIEKTGVKKIGTKNYLEYVIQKKVLPDETFVLYNGDIIEIKYQIDIPLGTSEIITRIYGYNYYEDKYIFEDEITKVRREYWKLKNLIIKESDFESKKILVGEPVEWLKTIEVYNPNDKDIKDIYTTKVFADRLNVKVLESRNGSTNEIKIEKEKKATIDFFVDIKAKERIIYFVVVNTPPVLEIKRDENILEIKNNSVLIKLKITLKNFAKYDYKDVYLKLPMQNILECNFEFFSIENETKIKIPEIKALENKTVDILYKEKPPILKMYTDKLEYSNDEKINLTLIVVPSERRGYIEIEINGPGELLNTVYVDVLPLEKIKERTNLEIWLNQYPGGNYTIYSYYKSNFQPILIAKETFSVSGAELFEIPWIVFLLIVVVIVALLIRKIYRKRTLDQEIEELKRGLR